MTDDDSDGRLRTEVVVHAVLQSARGQAYRQGEYELDAWEGFTCTECGWRGLSAPMADDWGIDDDGDLSVVQCDECGAPSPETSDEPTRWGEVLLKLLDSDADITFDTHE